MIHLKKSRLFIYAGVILIAAASLLTAYNIYSNYRAGKASDEALSVLNQQIELDSANSLDTKTLNDTPLYKRYPDMEMPTVNIDGYDYVGTLRIDSLNLTLPIISEFSYPNLRTAPCRYEGSAYKGNLVIAGHNYARHFGYLKNISIGDKASFTDTDGNVFNYKAVEVTQIDGTDVDGMLSGDWDMTLFTCTLSGTNRVTVRFTQIE